MRVFISWIFSMSEVDVSLPWADFLKGRHLKGGLTKITGDKSKNVKAKPDMGVKLRQKLFWGGEQVFFYLQG